MQSYSEAPPTQDEFGDGNHSFHRAYSTLRSLGHPGHRMALWSAPQFWALSPSMAPYSGVLSVGLDSAQPGAGFIL